ncbi:MAG: DUF1028 domain-containing protein [Methanomassiliicoccales archaeon]
MSSVLRKKSGCLVDTMQIGEERLVSTFSIVAYDPETGDLGVAVQSKFIAVGAVVPWARAGVGAVATQAYANTTYGPEGLKLLEEGKTPSEALELLTAGDRNRDIRQAGMVDTKGRSATYTGRKCMKWAGGISGENYAAQGNILAGPEVVQAMSDAFLNVDGDLPEKLLASLHAGQKAGGDRRGQESAALLVVRGKGGYGGFNDKYIDLRVDDHTRPIDELERLFRLYDLMMLSRKGRDALLAIDSSICSQIQRKLLQLGYYSGSVSGRYSASTARALAEYLDINNFENKRAPEKHIWKSVLDYMKKDRKRRQK